MEAAVTLRRPQLRLRLGQPGPPDLKGQAVRRADAARQRQLAAVAR
jgi:hypothetical protein